MYPALGGLSLPYDQLIDELVTLERPTAGPGPAAQSSRPETPET
jgi:hypothetical protein